MTDQLISKNWVLLCTILVLLMQVGFLWLETGLIRQKSKVNVAVKNMADFCVSAAVFWAFGFGLMFGLSQYGLFGFSSFWFQGSTVDAWDQIFFFFQMAFCGTAVTIVSGAIAERVTFRGYILTAFICSAIVYPVFGHWAWGGLLLGTPTGWLEQMGFIDFAGSTVVHGIGGWVALAAAIVVGPRLGRFGRRDNVIRPHDLALAMAGSFILWIGWFGFNGGSVLALDNSVPGILLNTLMAPAAGGIAGLSISWLAHGRPQVTDLVNGVLAGLVAITANCHIVTIQEAFVIGAIGGGICYYTCQLLAYVRIDDAVSAVPVHLAAGIWGTLAVALFGDLSAFGPGIGRLDQFLIQFVGVASAGGYALGVTLPLLWVAHKLGLMRVSPRDEVSGLNISEHDAVSPVQELLQQMEHQARHGDFSQPVRVPADTEASVLAGGYNRVLNRVMREQNEKSRMLKDLDAARLRAESANIAKSQFLSNVSHELRTPLNAIIGFSQVINAGAAESALSPDEREYLNTIQDSSTHLLSLITQVLKFTDIEANKLDLTETEFTLAEVLGDALTFNKTRIDRDKLNVVREFDGSLILRGDRDAVYQICLNILSNAIKSSPPGGMLRIGALATSDGSYDLVFSDSGPGLSAAKLARVMDPFDQGLEHGNLDKPDGLGLGLPIAQRLAQLHGGAVTLQSMEGQGCTVIVRFPPERCFVAGENAAEAGL